MNGVKIDVHRFVMEQYLGRKLKRDEVVHHKDGDRANNYLSNLQLMSLSNHGKLHRPIGAIVLPTTREKLRKKGRNNRNGAKLSFTDIKEIRLLLDNQIPQKEIAQRYKVHIATISKIKVGTTWAWV